MARTSSTLLVLALLAATAAAFAITEQLKLVPTPIIAPKIETVFSPTCECLFNTAEIEFKLRRNDTITVDVIDNGDREVATLGRWDTTGRVWATSWDGRTTRGALVPEGEYRVRVHLERARRTIVIPNVIRVDTTPPRIVVERVVPPVFSPDGDRRRDKIVAFYRVDEPAKVFLYANGKRRIVGRGHKLTGKLEWYGRVRGRPLPPGPYRVSLLAVDRAGNRTSSVERGVTLRYVTLARETIRARAGFRFGVRISTDATGYAWVFAGRTGRATRKKLVLRAPDQPGRYRLFVEARGHADSAGVIVEPRGG